MQYGFYFNQNRCIGCFTCVIACKDWNHVPAGQVSWMRVSTTEGGKYPQPFVAFLPVPCYHCAQPSCVSICPGDAIAKRNEDGVVVVERENCLGKDDCGLCLDACPYSAPQFEDVDDAKIQKCNFCLERWEKGKKPICVMACPVEALDAGPIEELKTKYCKNQEALGFAFSTETSPSILIKKKLT